MSSFLKLLRKYREDRGLMANLRCVLVESKKHRAWAALSRLGVSVDNTVDSFIAGLYATYPEETEEGNFGDTCRRIDHERGEVRVGDEKDLKLSATEKRFQQLLSAERSEVFGRVLRMVHMAKANNIPVNYDAMTNDLRYWGDVVKIQWAGAFWGRSEDQKNKKKESGEE